MIKKSHLNDQAKLKVVCDELCNNIENLLDYFELEYKDHGKMLSMACPIHSGDNTGALNLYIQGDNYRGNWKCRTHQCEKVFKGSIIGFIRGILSNRKYDWSQSGDKVCTFKETIDFITTLIKKDLKDIKISTIERNKNKFTNAISHISSNTPVNTTNYPNRTSVRSLLKIPSQYYIDRGFSAEILDKYDIGLCSNPNKEMYNRIVVPIYDIDYQHMIGCSGRSIFSKCEKCNCFHDSNKSCPEDSKKYLYSKWKHSANFKSQHCLYNFWSAKTHIQKTGIAIIVESPGNVWKLEENGIHNSVAVFGTNLSDRQKFLLDASGAMNLIVLMDNDDAGKRATTNIVEKCKMTYQMHTPSISKADIAEMTPQEINSEIKSVMEKIL